MFGFKSKKQKNTDAKLLTDAKKIVDDAKEKERLAKIEPSVILKGLIQQPDGTIKIELDWDDEFITHLKKNGYTGADDNAIIQKYILELTDLIANDLSDGTEYE